MEQGIDGIDKWITSGKAETYLQGVMDESMKRYNKECEEQKAILQRQEDEKRRKQYEEKVSLEGTKQMVQDIAAAKTNADTAVSNAMAKEANKNIGKMTPAEQKEFDNLLSIGQMGKQAADNAVKPAKSKGKDKSKDKQKSKGWFSR